VVAPASGVRWLQHRSWAMLSQLRNPQLPIGKPRLPISRKRAIASACIQTAPLFPDSHRRSAHRASTNRRNFLHWLQCRLPVNHWSSPDARFGRA
jgi:hypothetical protein